MRSLNLIPMDAIVLTHWKDRLTGAFPNVWLDHSETLARREGQPAGMLNELVVEDGDDHVDVLDRPTTIREYEPDEIEALRSFIGEPTQFFAVDYTDEKLLRRVLTTLLQHEGRDKILVEDEKGDLAFLEHFLELG